MGPDNDYGVLLQTNCKDYCHSKFQVHGSHSENCNKRDLQNTFNIQTLQISEYLNYNTHTSP